MTAEQIALYVFYCAFDVKTNAAKSARKLGVIFDITFTFRSHISAVSSSCFYHIRDLLRVRRYLDLDSTNLLATALVSSRRDYCRLPSHGIVGQWLHKSSMYSESNGPLGDKVTSIYLQCSTGSFPSLVTHKI